MTSRNVIFPGIAGDYISAADTNLLDADTAHLQQSIGEWEAAAFGAIATFEVAPTAPIVGTGAAKVVSNGASGFLFTDTGTSGQPVTGSAAYTVMVNVVGSADATGQIRIIQYDAGGSSLGATLFGSVDSLLGQSTSVLLQDEFTAAATAAFWEIRMQSGGTIVNGDVFWVLDSLLADGSVATFVPSIRIVGDDSSELVAALTDYTPSSSEVLWDDGATKCTLDTAGDFTFEMWGDTSAAMTPLVALVDTAKHTFLLTGIESTGVITFKIDTVTQDTDTLIPGSPTYADLSVFANTAPANEGTGDGFSYTRRDGIAGPVVAAFDADDIVL